jgi:hypothetical protein
MQRAHCRDEGNRFVGAAPLGRDVSQVPNGGNDFDGMAHEARLILLRIEAVPAARRGRPSRELDAGCVESRAADIFAICYAYLAGESSGSAWIQRVEHGRGIAA